ncbi:MAG: biotin transporter BioY [Oscillospiraceae bacterium]|nr:biotin transporter BioY [Oscillospiraceae bacterium]
MSVKSLVNTRQLTICAVMAALMCVLAPVSIPIGPISITGGTLAIYLTAYLLGGKWGALTTLVYLLVGFVGLPVFSNYMGGAERLAGPTGGYLVGYLPMVLLAGGVIQWSAHRFDEKGQTGAVMALAVQLLGMVAATAVLYAFGTAWYCVQAGVDLQKALAACVIPFIPWDLIKMALALTVGVPLRRRLERAGLL